MIRNPIDVATRVSPNLSALFENCLNRSKPEQDVTLGMARDFVTGLLTEAFTETEQLHHFDINESLVDELNALIEEYGETAAAIDFIQRVASEPLSRVIEALVSDMDLENPPTLDMVRDAMVSGLTASLVGSGVLDEDEDDNLLAEIESLIDRHGSEAFAEEFIRYE
ncbi:hypothetical protein [Nitrosomonas supralitoralis]|uniref:Uncharacterized protein n=1 Tax=Nitrosomonas supralitoralis TaxID=2116706 RepID=A0A2P7NXC8_9PROT|nr:hypothetical protein [Nitrosomonas supralitoralis]PSJ18118.1 hypothetical protein C7H79_04485 [Nitrosomonas supralitoralis]